MSTLSILCFACALALYLASGILFFTDVARARGRASISDGMTSSPPPPPGGGMQRHAPLLLGVGAMFHFAYVTVASFVLEVCPIHSVSFILSMTSLLAIVGYLLARRAYRIDALGLLVSPLALAFLLSTFFLARPVSDHPQSAAFIALHVLSNLAGIALFVLAGATASLYLVQERRLKQKKLTAIGRLPPLDVLDRAVHRFLVAGFPMLTIGILTGTFWARNLEVGAIDDVMRFVFSSLTWLLIAGVLLLRALLGWRGRRAAYGTIAGLSCALAVVIVYIVRPMVGGG